VEIGDIREVTTVQIDGYNRRDLDCGVDRGIPEAMVLSFMLPDQGGQPWVLADHLDSGVVIVTLRGDW
jgi:hypothetical protein